VEAPGIEGDSGQRENTIQHEKGSMRVHADPAIVPDRASKCAIVRDVVTQSSEPYELSNVVETALARALVLAAEARRWDVVMQIAAELSRRGSAQPTSFAPSERLKRSSKV
jgi:hypothetical protein